MTTAASSIPPSRLTRRGLVRRGWLVPLCAAAVAAIALGLADLRNDRVTGQSDALVSSRPGKIGPGAAFEASRLALSYAAVLGQDSWVVDRVAREVGATPTEVRDRLTISNPTDTAALHIAYRDASPQLAAAGSRAAARAIVGSRPASPSVGPGTVQIVRLADPPHRPDDSVLAAVVGALLGLGLGVVLLLGRERADRRIDAAPDARAQTGLPVTAIDELTPATARALGGRWARMSPGRSVRVAVVPVDERLSELAEEVAVALHPVDADVAVVASGAPQTDGRAEADVLDADVRVLLIARGTRERDLDRALDLLGHFGAPVGWLLFAARPHRAAGRLARERAAVSEAEPETVAAGAGVG